MHDLIGFAGGAFAYVAVWFATPGLSAERRLGASVCFTLCIDFLAFYIAK